MSEQFSLGQLIDALEAVSDKSIDVRFDFCGLIPTEFDSWRGIYSQMALGYLDRERMGGPDAPTVQDLLNKAKAADGASMYGWKGGEYWMSRDTELWVDNPGEYNHTVITGVTSDSYQAVLTTRHEPDIW